MHLVDQVEEVFYHVNPFGYTDEHNYYFEANNLIKMLPYMKKDDTVLDMCMDAFHIHYDGNPMWDRIANEIAQLLSAVKLQRWWRKQEYKLYLEQYIEDLREEERMSGRWW